ncbi:MAG: phosphoribosylaminoimidazolesuccinocarboxamide synthase, partial [Bacteroidia bacterium]
MSIGLESTHFNFKGQLSKYTGKVREVYTLDNDRIVMVATDRISAFDHILPEPIVHKGEVRAYPIKILNWHEIVNDRI